MKGTSCDKDQSGDVLQKSLKKTGGIYKYKYKYKYKDLSGDVLQNSPKKRPDAANAKYS